MLTALQEQALVFFDTYLQRRAVFEKANHDIERIVHEDVGCDFSGLHLRDMDGWVLTAMCELLDAIFTIPQSGLFSYFLHEAYGRGERELVRCCGDKGWRLNTLADLRAYLIHATTECRQPKPAAA